MKDKKEISGRFHRVTRVKGGTYGIETVVLEKGKIIGTEEVEPNYPSVTLAKFGKQAFMEAQNLFDEESKDETRST